LENSVGGGASKDLVKYDFPAIAWTGKAKSVVIAAKSFNTAGDVQAINYWWQPQGASGWEDRQTLPWSPPPLTRGHAKWLRLWPT
jgi:hypothetical protein